MPTHGHSGSTDAQGYHQHSIPNGETPSSGSEGEACASTPRGQVHNIVTGATGSHTHNVAIANTGGNGRHNNLQPYVATIMWQRTA